MDLSVLLVEEVGYHATAELGQCASALGRKDVLNSLREGETTIRSSFTALARKLCAYDLYVNTQPKELTA